MIVVCGEALIDRLPLPPPLAGEGRGGGPVDSPGGGPFTTARALARLGIPTQFLGRLSTDAFGRQLRDLLDYLDVETSPGEAIFVYPSSPLLYVLANRPNPTRYSHVYPGMSTADQQRLASTLDRARVRIVVVSDAWVDFWGSTEGDSVLDAYLNTNFQEQARFGVYRVLIRLHSA